MYDDKYSLLYCYRSVAEKELKDIILTTRSYKEQAKKINKVINNIKNDTINALIEDAKKNRWDNEYILNCVLYITYASYVVMLEFRNKVWPYEYMSFARRIGELWEPFCKETFAYPVKELELIEPPKFEEVQDEIQSVALNFIDSLSIDSTTKRMLRYYYGIPWNLVDSGGIKLGLDLHFSQNGINYNCDFKSGFNSNEKGNTNRLLLVASIYRMINSDEKTILFVRQNEDENNHYLQTLKTSGYWQVYCSDKAYAEMHEFTGFNLKKWINNNIQWIEDISDEFRAHLEKEDLLKYLTW